MIGKFGLTQSEGLPDHLAANDIVTAAAESIRAPTLQHVQWDDEIFPRQGQLDLFDLFPSPDKQLRGRTGTHAFTRPEPGGLTVAVNGHLLTGDTLFPGGPGLTGTAWPTSNFAAIIDSIKQLMDQPDSTGVHPGHGGDTTIGTERPHVPRWHARGW